MSLPISKLEAIFARYRDIEALLCKPETLQDSSLFRKLSMERASLEETVTHYQEYKKISRELEDAKRLHEIEKDPEFRTFLFREQEVFRQKLDNLENTLTLLLIPKDPNDGKNILMEIRAGTGGDEAALFAAELLRMYTRYAERNGWKTELMSINATGLGGIKEAVFSVQGKDAWASLKFESGVHRVQRVPETEAGGRIHTSTATVAVLPEAEEVDIQIREQDLRLDTFRASGAGGQHVNKTESAVRITHLPTGTVVACQDERSQHQNREKAMRILRAHLYQVMQEKQAREQGQMRRQQVGTGERSEKIRTYNFPQSRVTDHRAGFSAHAIKEFLDGDLNAMVAQLRQWESEQLLREPT